MLVGVNMKVCINDNVPLDSRNQNAKDRWYFSRRVGDKDCDISFNVTINKKTKAIEIDVLDELFLQPYDYQMYIGTIPVANHVYDDVQKWMKYLMDNGVIYGYTLGDYI